MLRDRKGEGVKRYAITITGNEDGSFAVEYFELCPDLALEIVSFIVWGLSVIRATPALMRAAGFTEAP